MKALNGAVKYHPIHNHSAVYILFIDGATDSKVKLIHY